MVHLKTSQARPLALIRKNAGGLIAIAYSMVQPGYQVSCKALREMLSRNRCQLHKTELDQEACWLSRRHGQNTPLSGRNCCAAWCLLCRHALQPRSFPPEQARKRAGLYF